MKNMKRIVALIAMLAVLLSSFAFAEGEIAVEAVESIDAAVVMAEAPAEEAAAEEEINAELLAEEIPVATAAAEEAVAPAAACAEHVVYCFMPDVCLFCGTPVEGVTPKHVDNLYDKAPVPLPDAPTLHGYYCDACKDYVSPEEHFTSCLFEDTSVCGVCGVAISADQVWHEGLKDAKVTAIPGTDTHGRLCPTCNEYQQVDVHYVDCLNSNKSKCEGCGTAIGEQFIVHDGKYEYGMSSSCSKCGESKGIEKVEVVSELVLGEGETYTLGVKIIPEVSAAVKYAVTAGSCVSVNANGLVTANAKGSATITVTATTPDGKSVSADVAVTVKAAPTGVTLSESSMTVYIGQKAPLTATLKGSSSAAQLRWESSNPAVATVDANGVITPISSGETTITVSTYKSGVKDSCKITVTPKPTWIEVAETDLRMYHKQTFDLNARLVDDNGVECAGELYFESSDPKIVEVSDSGKLTVKKNEKGTTVIITITSSNKLSGDVYVTVCDVPSKVKLPETKATLDRGETYQLEPIIDADETTVFTYSSSKKTVATVDENGLITAVGEGSATITVKSHNNKKATIKITVVDPYAPTGVELDQSGTVNLGLGYDLQLTAVLKPATAESELKWKSSSTKVATVDENGLVTGIKTGTATITVETYNGKKDTVKIKVVDPKVVSAVVLDQSGTVTVGIGEILSLNAEVQPSTAETTLSWKSSSTKVATVDEDGNVEGVKTGTATITVSSKNGKKDTVKVKVIDPTVADSVVLDQSGTITTNVGEPIQLNAEVIPATAETELTWSASNKKYASVDENGLVIPKAKGTVTITVKTDNGKKDTVKIKVVDNHKPTSISLPSVSGLTVGKQDILTPDITPFDAKTVLTWESSNEKVLTVEDGVITAVGVGTATITVETHNGKEASVKITVGEGAKPASITASILGSGVIGIGESARISATVLPADAVYTLSYVSSNAAVAKVDANGLVTGVAAGNAVITVSTNNGVSTTVSVTVDPNKDPNSTVELGSAINGSLNDLRNLVGELKGSGSSYSDASGAMSVTLVGNRVKYVQLVGSSRFSIFGVKVGMDLSEVESALTKNGVSDYAVEGFRIMAEISGCAVEITIDNRTAQVDSIGVFSM